MISVNVRVPKQMVESIDEWVKKGEFASRSEAIKSMISFYEEREKTRQFAELLTQRSEEARRDPKCLIPLQLK